MLNLILLIDVTFSTPTPDYDNNQSSILRGNGERSDVLLDRLPPLDPDGDSLRRGGYWLGTDPDKQDKEEDEHSPG